MHGDEIVGALIILTIGCLIFYSLFLRFRKRELQHKERLAALDKGMPLPEMTEIRESWSPRTYLLRGMIWMFSGIALAAFLAAISPATRTVPRVEDRLWRVENLKRMNASEEQIKQVMDDTTPDKGLPLSVSLLGLVPIGVGLAYLIYYRVESKAVVRPA